MRPVRNIFYIFIHLHLTLSYGVISLNRIVYLLPTIVSVFLNIDSEHLFYVLIFRTFFVLINNTLYYQELNAVLGCCIIYNACILSSSLKTIVFNVFIVFKV